MRIWTRQPFRLLNPRQKPYSQTLQLDIETFKKNTKHC